MDVAVVVLLLSLGFVLTSIGVAILVIAFRGP